MGNQLAGKKALITGGGSGIGRAIAAAFSAAGAIVAILGRSEKVIEAAAALGDTVYPYQADIVDAASIRKAIAKIGQENCFIPSRYIEIVKGGVENFSKEFQDNFEDIFSNFPFEIKEGIYTFSDPIQNQAAKNSKRL